MDIPLSWWVGFNVFVLAMLALDLGVFHRQSHAVGVKEALTWSGVWIALALAFNAGVYFLMGEQAGLEFLTGYLVEKSLSVDNIFVFLMAFGYFKVPAAYQHRVLFWGVLGALIMRAALIFVGAAVLARFHWVIYVFGGFLVLTGAKMAFQSGPPPDPRQNLVVRLVRRLMPVTEEYHGESFFVRKEGVLLATPLLLVLVLIEFTDLVFAVDSIPAIFAVTKNPFIVYTSNVFAILGLRSLYFALSGVVERFHCLKYGLAGVLVFVGAKMCLVDVYKVPIGVSLGVIATLLAASVVASLVLPPPAREEVPA